MYDISRIAYELYKQNWVDTHTTREMRLDNIRNWGKIEIEDDSPDSPDTYEAYREEFGVLCTFVIMNSAVLSTRI